MNPPLSVSTYDCVCSCLGWAAVDPVGVGVWREAARGVLVRGDIQRMSLRDPTRRERLSSDRRERGERRSIRLEDDKQSDRVSIH